tara:strand:- start:2365 stop:2745 length:381 start_codon:yes stop_codon:yes gene_type:complete
MKKTLEHFEAMGFNQLIIELNDLAYKAEQETIFAKHPQLRPDYDAGQNSILNEEMRIEIYLKIALRKSVEKSFEIILEMMALLMVLEQRAEKVEGALQGMEELVTNLVSRIKNSTQKTFELYTNAK